MKERQIKFIALKMCVYVRFPFFPHIYTNSHRSAVAVVVIEVWLIFCHFFTWQTEKYAQIYKTSSIFLSRFLSRSLSIHLLCSNVPCPLSIRLHSVGLQSDIRPAFTLYICSTQLICIFPFHIHHLNEMIRCQFHTVQNDKLFNFRFPHHTAIEFCAHILTMCS